MSGMMQTIKRLFGGDADTGALHAVESTASRSSEDSLKRAAKNVETIQKMVGESVSDAIILQETMQCDGKEVGVEVRSDKILLQDAENQESRVIRLNEEDLSPYQTIDLELRLQLGQKIARLTPKLAHENHEKLLEHTIKVLKTIAQDQNDRVRMMVAEELADLPNAPQEIINQLAHDSCARVACPILEFSPLLRDHELINILQTCDLAGASESIARRQHISSEVSDAIIEREEDSAITLLLENEGAKISDNGMNAIIALAPEHENWHASLIQRPELTQKTVARIAQFMSQDILMRLEERGDIKRKHKRHARAAVQHRLGSWTEEQYRKAEQRAKMLHAKGMLDDESIDTAIHQIDEPFVTAALTMRAMMTREKVRKILRSDSARAITALAWEAGLPMRSAYAMQMKIGQIHHAKLMHPRGGSDYPLSEEDMEMVLDIFS